MGTGRLFLQKTNEDVVQKSNELAQHLSHAEKGLRLFFRLIFSFQWQLLLSNDRVL
jgi:hypothetical protein